MCLYLKHILSVCVYMAFSLSFTNIYSPSLRHCILQTTRGRTDQEQEKTLMAQSKESVYDPDLHPQGLR